MSKRPAKRPTFTPNEIKMIAVMTEFTRRNSGHVPWEKLVSESRKQLLAERT